MSKPRLLGHVLGQNGNRCHYCGIDVYRAGDPEAPCDKNGWPLYSNLATVDHRTPRDRGGTDEPWNLVLACFMCNSRKGRRPYLDFVFDLHLRALEATA